MNENQPSPALTGCWQLILNRQTHRTHTHTNTHSEWNVTEWNEVNSREFAKYEKSDIQLKCDVIPMLMFQRKCEQPGKRLSADVEQQQQQRRANVLKNDDVHKIM